MLCRNASDVEHAHILFVERDRFRRCALLRTEVCETCQAVHVDEAALARLPEDGVPEALLHSAQHLPEAEQVRFPMDGPAQRQSLFVGVEEAAELPIEEVDEVPY